MSAEDQWYLDTARRRGDRLSAFLDGPSPSVRRADGIADARAGRAPSSSDTDYMVGHRLGSGLSRTNGTRPGSKVDGDVPSAATDTVAGVPDGLSRAMAGAMEPSCRRAADAGEATVLQWQILRRTEEAAARLLPHLLAAGLDAAALDRSLREPAGKPGGVA